MKTSIKMAVLLSTAAAFALPSAASAQVSPGAKTQSGTVNGLSYVAKSLIIGQDSTATIAGGGNPIYRGDSRHSGTVGLLMRYANGAGFVCSGSLSANRSSIITAAHCVSGGPGTEQPVSVTAYFYDGAGFGDSNVYAPGADGVTTVEVDFISVNPDYTGEVIDQNDIAVLRLGAAAPDFAQGYALYNAGDLTGQQFNVAGYGARSDTGGAVGRNLGTGRLRQGENVYDFALGDDDWGGFFDGQPDGGFFGTADVEFSYLSDFDNGLEANDASCMLAGAFGLGGAKYCNTGLGALEVNIAGGDSGGPQFIDGQLAGVNSYGLAFRGLGDVDDALNSSWGEFSGYVPTFIHADWIAGVVPEPATWAMLIFGFGMVGGAMRTRKRNVKVSYA